MLSNSLCFWDKKEPHFPRAITLISSQWPGQLKNSTEFKTPLKHFSVYHTLSEKGLSAQECHFRLSICLSASRFLSFLWVQGRDQSPSGVSCWTSGTCPTPSSQPERCVLLLHQAGASPLMFLSVPDAGLRTSPSVWALGGVSRLYISLWSSQGSE